MLWEGKSALVGGHRARKPIYCCERDSAERACVCVCGEGGGEMRPAHCPTVGFRRKVMQTADLISQLVDDFSLRTSDCLKIWKSSANSWSD